MFDVALTSGPNTTHRPKQPVPGAQRSSLIQRLAPVAIGVLAMLAAPAQAQYQWRDADGKMVFSDRPPPSATPTERIVRQPARSGAARALEAEQQAAADGKGDGRGEVKATLDPDGKDKEPKTPQEKWQALQKAKAKAAQEDSERKADEARQQRLAEDCNRMKSYRGSLEAGVKMSTTGANGEREIMDDQRREAEMKRVRQDIADNCDRPAKAAPAPLAAPKR